MDDTTITVQADIHAPVEKVWRLYTEPEHITHWNHASDDWHCPRAENDLRVGGKFLFRMEAKAGRTGFDYYGTYDEIELNKLIVYNIAGVRRVRVAISEEQSATGLTIQFEAENTNPFEIQRRGWQAILDNFKKYTEELTDDHL